jgi:hypothetical protein
MGVRLRSTYLSTAGNYLLNTTIAWVSETRSLKTSAPVEPGMLATIEDFKHYLWLSKLLELIQG